MRANEFLPASARTTAQPPSIPLPFDLPASEAINRARLGALDWILDAAQCPIANACDLGTGIGNFAGHLSIKRKLAVSAVDIRASNVGEARTRFPDVRFAVADVEDPAVLSLGQFDLVTAFGLFYHLENPFRAARNAAALSRELLIVESMVCPGKTAEGVLVDEFAGQDQGVNSVAFQLTEAGLIKLLYRAGMSYVYSPRERVNHREFHEGLFRRRIRTILVASRRKLPNRYFLQHTEPSCAVDRAYYYRSILALCLRPVLRYRRARRPAADRT